MLDTELLIALAPLFVQHPYLSFTAFICWCGKRPAVALCNLLAAWLKRPKPQHRGIAFNQSPWTHPKRTLPSASRRAPGRAGARPGMLPARPSFSVALRAPALPALAASAWARLLASSAQ